MNRREFTASLAALVASPAVPLPALSAAPVAATTNSSMAYMFADLIARSRGTVDAGFLARRLKLTAGTAQQVMSDLAANNVIGAPGLGGVANAVKPFDFQLPMPRHTVDLTEKIGEHIDHLMQDTPDTDAPLEIEDIPVEIDET